MYEVAENANGVRQWKLTQAARQFADACNARSHVRIVLRPEVQEVVPEEDSVAPARLGKQRETQLVASKQAFAVVWQSAATLAIFLEGRAYVRRVSWDARRRVYVLDVASTADAGEVCEEAQSVYGDAAADTWMEGDLQISPDDKHLFVHLVQCDAA